MSSHPQRRAVHAPARGCTHCDELRALLRESEAALAEQCELREAAEHQARRSGMAELRLQAELDGYHETKDPKRHDIQRILRHWQQKTGHPKSSIALSGKRAKVVRAALRHHKPDACLEALDGLAHYPYVGQKGRAPTGLPEQRYDDVEHALGDEVRIDRARRLAQTIAGASSALLGALWQEINATERAYFAAYMNARDLELDEQLGTPTDPQTPTDQMRLI